MLSQVSVSVFIYICMNSLITLNDYLIIDFVLYVHKEKSLQFRKDEGRCFLRF